MITSLLEVDLPGPSSLVDSAKIRRSQFCFSRPEVTIRFTLKFRWESVTLSEEDQTLIGLTGKITVKKRMENYLCKSSFELKQVGSRKSELAPVF